MTQEVVLQNTATSALTVANIAELVSATVSRIAGHDISFTMNGENLTREAVKMLAMQKVAELVKADITA